MTEGKITISHPRSSKDTDGWISVEIRYDDMIVTADVELDVFASAITGTALLPCNVSTFKKVRDNQGGQ